MCVQFGASDLCWLQVGYSKHAIGPFGLRGEVKAVLVDEELASIESLTLGAGEEGLVFEIPTQVLLAQPMVTHLLIHF